ncbi:TonB-dependent receptor [candidate division KSB1 bacterium]|nr:TonB-dependent receptor [candidate division KSB1 bacterium]
MNTVKAKNCSLIIFLLLAFFLFFGTQIVFSQINGQITGKIIEAEGKTPLPGANVLIEGTHRGASTDANGRFTISKIPPGTYTLKTSFLGYQDQAQEIKVLAGQQTRVEFALKETVLEGEQVIVYGELTRGQAKALQKQKTAENIVQVVSEEFFGRFPDRNAAETVRRLPAVSVARDQGEGEFVMIRGMNQEYNALTLNGVRIPSPDPDNGVRSVGLDLINNRLLGEIQVIKAITPDMDGDAVGGVVNFGLRRAPAEGTAVFGISGGFNNQMSDFETYGRDIQEYYGVFGKRFFNKKLGVLVDGAFYKTNRHSKLKELNYTDDDGIYDEVIFGQHTNDYDVKRQRYGLSLSSDYEFNPLNRIYLTLNHNTYLDDEIRREVEYIITSQNETRETRNRLEDQRLNLGMFGGEHNLGWMQLDYKAAWIKASEAMPDRTYLRFARKNTFDGLSNEDIKEADGTTQFTGLDPLTLNRIRYDDNLKEDQDLSGQLNITIPFIFQNQLSNFKIGAKWLEKTVAYDVNRYEIKKFNNGPVTIGEGEFGFEDVRYDGEELEPYLTPWKELANYTNSYDASETITSLYGMASLKFNPKLSTVMGIRYEDTQTDFTQPYSPYANIIGQTSLTGSGGYNNILPSVHLMYKFNRNNNLKLAYSTGLARPRYVDLIPRMNVSDPPNSNSSVGKISYGNPDLEPRTAYNFDIMYDRFTTNLGLLSVGMFYKNFKAWHASRTWMEQHDFVNDDGDYTPDGIAETYEAQQLIMGDGTATYYGIEVNAQQRLSSLHPTLKWFAVNANYTYTKSEGEVDGRKVVMTRSPKHIGNLSLIYDNSQLGLSIVVAANYRDAILTGVGANKYRDVYFDHEFFVDISIVQKITEKILVIGQLNGLGITDEHELLGNPREDYARTQQWEKYGIFGTIGLQYTIW